jgi:hypothetical protein
MPDFLYTDDEVDVFDVTQDLIDMHLCMWGGKDSDKCIVRAERRGRETLILSKRTGGHWWVTNWTSKTPQDALNSVWVSDESKFARRQIDPNESLFKQVRLFC